MSYAIKSSFKPNGRDLFSKMRRHKGERPQRWFLADSYCGLGVGTTPHKAVLNLRKDYRAEKRRGQS